MEKMRGKGETNLKPTLQTLLDIHLGKLKSRGRPLPSICSYTSHFKRFCKASNFSLDTPLEEVYGENYITARDKHLEKYKTHIRLNHAAALKGFARTARELLQPGGE